MVRNGAGAGASLLLAVLFAVMLASQLVAEAFQPANQQELVDALVACCDTETGGSCTHGDDWTDWYYFTGAGCEKNGVDLTDWDTSLVTNMNETFNRAYGFSADVGDWDVSAVTDMYMMFYKCNTFDHDLNGWDVSGVTNMVKMFRDCYSFNGDVSDWDVSSVTDMEAMFEYAYAFNADLSGWDVSSVTSFEDAFYYALSFEGGDLSRWDVSNVKNMYEMFGYGVSFDGFLSGWDVSSVTDFEYMFEDAYVFRGIGLEDWTFNAAYTDSDSYASDQVHNIGLWWNKNFIGDITNWPMAPEFSVYDLNRRAYDCGDLNDVSTCTMQGCLAEEMGGVHIPHGTPGDCGDADLDHKDTCTPTCDAGYEAAGDVMCYGSYAISTFSCQPIMTCTGADAAPENGNKGDCPASLANGEDCTPSCDSGYTGYGARFCSSGSVIDKFECVAEAERCEITTPEETSEETSSPSNSTSSTDTDGESKGSDAPLSVTIAPFVLGWAALTAVASAM